MNLESKLDNYFQVNFALRSESRHMNNNHHTLLFHPTVVLCTGNPDTQCISLMVHTCIPSVIQVGSFEGYHDAMAWPDRAIH